MKPQLPPLLRLLLALLTVLASFAFQLRVDALGGLRAERTVSVTQLEAMLEQSTHCGEAQTQHAHHAPRQPAPHLPDEHAGHGAHCPFCLTNAFALEAGIVGLPQGPPHHLPTSDKGAEFCVLDAPSHADARAPPLERA